MRPHPPRAAPWCNEKRQISSYRKAINMTGFLYCLWACFNVFSSEEKKLKLYLFQSQRPDRVIRLPSHLMRSLTILQKLPVGQRLKSNHQAHMNNFIGKTVNVMDWSCFCLVTIQSILMRGLTVLNQVFSMCYLNIALVCRKYLGAQGLCINNIEFKIATVE